MFWLCLLAAVTVLVIALRRVLRRQKPLDDQLYSSKVAIDHVQSGVAWVRANGTIGSMNPSLAGSLGIDRGALDGQDWLSMFPERERDNVSGAHRQMLLLGIASMDIFVTRPDGSQVWLSMAMVAVHDHRARFVGHHCLTVDRTREIELEEQVKELTAALSGQENDRQGPEQRETKRRQAAETR
ncbi:MAG TPA: PAS domain-containing protein [Bryobacteraceae bacterium]|nr:PAS domain-containing protein [Bryobacteraceae bacterium]